MKTLNDHKSRHPEHKKLLIFDKRVEFATYSSTPIKQPPSRNGFKTGQWPLNISEDLQIGTFTIVNRGK